MAREKRGVAQVNQSVSWVFVTSALECAIDVPIDLILLRASDELQKALAPFWQYEQN
jgi:hypothetical protein